MSLILAESEELKEFREEQRKLQEKYHQMPMPVVTQWDVLSDENGKVLWASEIGLAKSWTRNAYNLLAQTVGFSTLYGSTFGDGYTTFKGTAGNMPSMGGAYSYYPVYNNNAIIYILLGSGNTAESFDSYALATLIANGAGAGQLTHGTGTINTSWISGSRIFRTQIVRSFTNNSGDSVSVAEKGLACSGLFRANSTSNGFAEQVLLQRDVLSSPASVANGKTWTAAYQIDSPAFPS